MLESQSVFLCDWGGGDVALFPLSVFCSTLRGELLVSVIQTSKHMHTRVLLGSFSLPGVPVPAAVLCSEVHCSSVMTLLLVLWGVSVLTSGFLGPVLWRCVVRRTLWPEFTCVTRKSLGGCPGEETMEIQCTHQTFPCSSPRQWQAVTLSWKEPETGRACGERWPVHSEL